MNRSSIAACGIALLLVLSTTASAQPAGRPCQFIRDFKRLHDLAPDTIGTCGSRRIFAPNGDVVQYTSNGLMVRRKADNRTAFTDGSVTYLKGPRGLVSRPNAERFGWEHDKGNTPAIPEPAARLGPPPAYPDPKITPG